MPIVTMPDKTQVSFPDDMPAEQIRGFIVSKFPDVVKPAVEPQGSPTAGLIGKVSSGLTVGLGDRAQAALVSGSAGTAQRVASALGADIKPQPYGKIYDEALLSAQEDSDAASRQYPISSYALEIGGGVAPALLGYGALAKLGMTGGKTFLRRRAKESALGALGSGAYTFNNAKGSIEDRASEAENSAIVGAFLSPFVGGIAEKLAKPIGSIASKGFNSAYEAYTGNPRIVGKAAPNEIASGLKKAVELNDDDKIKELLQQLNAGTAGKGVLPFEVPLSKGAITKDPAILDIEERARAALNTPAGKIMAEFGRKQNAALKSNISSLIKDSDVPADMVGDNIVNDVATAYGSAKKLKGDAYIKAKPLMEQAWLFKNSVKKFGNEMEETIKREFSPAMGRKVRAALNANMAEAKGANVPFSRIHDFNKQMGNFGAFGTPESAAGARAKALLRNFLNGDVITGDQTAVSAIRLADNLNVALKTKYLDERASPIVKEIVDSVDKKVAIAPEYVFRNIAKGNSKQNAHNVASLIEILGKEHPTVYGLRNSILQDIRDRATAQNGYLSPAKLASNIEKFVTTNRSVANQLISAEEITMLKKLADTARDIDYRGEYVKNNSNSANIMLRVIDKIAKSYIGRNIPFVPQASDSLMEAAEANTVKKLVAPTIIESKPIFGGVGDVGLELGKRVIR
jgi:hypothetical protein